jgi:hypothetical protein
MTPTFREIEDMYRQYDRLKDKLATLQPNNTQILSFMPIYHSGQSNVESIATERTEVENQIKFVQRCLSEMTHDERMFIHYRYFGENPMSIVSSLMNWQKRELFRLRVSVLLKTRWVIQKIT